MDLPVVVDSLPALLAGLALSLELTAAALAAGFALALPLAAAGAHGSRPLRAAAAAYVFVFRGSPLLVQIFLIYYGSGQFRPLLEDAGLWILFREAWFCALLALTLNTCAYTAEILRGALEAVPRGEVEAGRALGMSGHLLHRSVVLPRALRLALPAYSNEAAFLFQSTSLVSVVTLMDLTGVARAIAARTFDVYEIYLAAGLLYLAATYAILWGFRAVERRWRGGPERRGDAALRPHA